MWINRNIEIENHPSWHAEHWIGHGEDFTIHNSPPGSWEGPVIGIGDTLEEAIEEAEIYISSTGDY